MTLPPRILLSLALGGLMLVLGGIVVLPPILLDWQLPRPLPPELAPQQHPPALAETARPAIDQMIERPLFWTSRRPSAIEPDATPLEQAPPDEFPKDARLVGLYGSGDQAGAMLSINGTTKRLPVGEKLAGWQLKEARDGRALFIAPRGGQQHQLPLRQAAAQGDPGNKAKGPARKGKRNTQSATPPAQP